jgi:hypothetical protein
VVVVVVVLLMHLDALFLDIFPELTLDLLVANPSLLLWNIPRIGWRQGRAARELGVCLLFSRKIWCVQE